MPVVEKFLVSNKKLIELSIYLAFRFILSLNFHAGSEVASYPYDDSSTGESKSSLAPDDAFFKVLPFFFERIMFSVNGVCRMRKINRIAPLRIITFLSNICINATYTYSLFADAPFLECFFALIKLTP